MNTPKECSSYQCGQDDGERRKGDAHRLLEMRRQLYICRGRRALLKVMLAGNGTASADDVRDAVDLPADLDARCLGVVPSRLAYDGLIEPVGFTRSKRPERHAGWLQVWRLVDRAAAERWLQDHPDGPDPTDKGAPGERQGLLFEPRETATPTATTAGAAR